MAHVNLANRGSFGSKFGIIAAAAGSAIGLGNIWRFPYVTGESGGGAFLLIYLIFVLMIGIPVMLSEFIIGRTTQRNPFGAFKKLKPDKSWYLIGIMGILAAFAILAFYGAVGGWTLEYLYQSVAGGFHGKSSSEINDMFDVFQKSAWRPVVWQLIFMGFTMFIVAAGIEKGIEKYTKILMPMLLVIILAICVRSLTLPGSGQGLIFLFKPDFSKLADPDRIFGINYSIILSALGQAFFSLSIGMGTLITYGSYISKKDNLGNSAFVVSMADTLIAILAGVAIFPAVFAFGIQPSAGPALVFKTLPNIFLEMPGGGFFSILFFVLLGVAALTSSISVLEVVVAFLVEQFAMIRRKSTIIAGIAISILGILCALPGSNYDVRILGTDVFGVLEILATKFLLPLGGLAIVIFVGWFYGKGKTWREVSNRGHLRVWYLNIYMFLIKYIAPVAIISVFIYELIGLF